MVRIATNKRPTATRTHVISRPYAIRARTPSMVLHVYVMYSVRLSVDIVIAWIILSQRRRQRNTRK